MPVRFMNPPGLVRGPYAQVAVASGGRTVYVSGQVALDADGRIVGATFAEQCEQVFDNLRVALAAAGAEFRHVVKLNAYVRDPDPDKVRTLREIRARHLQGHEPASTVVGTPGLTQEALMLEVEAIAVVE